MASKVDIESLREDIQKYINHMRTYRGQKYPDIYVTRRQARMLGVKLYHGCRVITEGATDVPSQVDNEA